MGKPNKTDGALAPVVIALETIQVDHQVTFYGVDLDTGLRIQVGVDRPLSPIMRRNHTQARQLEALGLVLTLTIEPLALNS